MANWTVSGCGACLQSGFIHPSIVLWRQWDVCLFASGATRSRNRRHFYLQRDSNIGYGSIGDWSLETTKPMALLETPYPWPHLRPQIHDPTWYPKSMAPLETPNPWPHLRPQTGGPTWVPKNSWPHLRSQIYGPTAVLLSKPMPHKNISSPHIKPYNHPFPTHPTLFSLFSFHHSHFTPIYSTPPLNYPYILYAPCSTLATRLSKPMRICMYVLEIIQYWIITR